MARSKDYGLTSYQLSRLGHKAARSFLKPTTLTENNLDRFNNAIGDKYWINHQTGFTLQIGKTISRKGKRTFARISMQAVTVEVNLEKDKFYLDPVYPVTPDCRVYRTT